MSEPRSLARSILVPNFLLSLTAFLVIGLVSAVLLNGAVNRAFHEKLNAIQNLFRASVSQDILTGAAAETYSKCQTFFKDPGVVSIRIDGTSGGPICDLRKDGSLIDSTLALDTPVYFDTSGREKAAVIHVLYSSVSYHEILFRSVGLLVIAAVVLGFVQLLLARKINEVLSRPIQSNLDSLRDDLLKVKTQEAAFKVATQIAHDIRSPLAALAMVERELDSLPEDIRLLARSAIGRIRDIASGLLHNYRERPDSGRVRTTLISSLIEPLLSEKRIQYKARPELVIELTQDSASYGLFANVSTVELQRVLSNLINNCAEASPQGGLITLALAPSGDDGILLTLSDEGEGIAPELLARLGKPGETFGKKQGTGLGLAHALQIVESWNGTFFIRSKPGQGTCVEIRIPRAAAPNWFVSELRLREGGQLIVVDDDPSVHQIWSSRLHTLKTKSPIRLTHFSSPEELRTWISVNAGTIDVTYLIDYEYIGAHENGLDLIQESKLVTRGVLVTSRYDETEIQDGCLSLGVGLIPKSMAGFVPIRVISTG